MPWRPGRTFLTAEECWRRMNIGKKHRKDLPKVGGKRGTVGASPSFRSAPLGALTLHVDSSAPRWTEPLMVLISKKGPRWWTKSLSFSVRTWFPDFKPFQTSWKMHAIVKNAKPFAVLECAWSWQWDTFSVDLEHLESWMDYTIQTVSGLKHVFFGLADHCVIAGEAGSEELLPWTLLWD